MEKHSRAANTVHESGFGCWQGRDLGQLELLEIVMMRNTDCDTEGIKRFQAARPEVGVIHQPRLGSAESP